LAKFRQFTTALTNFGHFERDQLVFAKDLLWPILIAVGQILIVENATILKNNQTIWSHCSLGKISLS